jgi:hypothetical protein
LKEILLITACLIFYSSLPIVAQQKDSIQLQKNNAFGTEDTVHLTKVQKKKIYSAPRRASIMSAILPGLGQAVNKKYWKIPIIYAGLGGFGYLFAVNNKEYNYYRKNLIAQNDNDSTTLNITRYTTSQLQEEKNFYKKNRDFTAIGMVLIYLFNIIDANVDAHLKTFDVGDNLTLQIDPWQNIYRASSGYRSSTGLSLKLTFK